MKRLFSVILRRPLKHLVGDDRGAMVVEVAIAFTTYITVVIGAVQVALWALTSSAAQFAVWEGCRAGAAAYQPAPPDGTGSGGLSGQQGGSNTEMAAAAVFAATDRTEIVLGWLPVTSDFYDLGAAVEEEDIAPGAEGRREISAQVKVRPVILFPIANEFIEQSGSDVFVIVRACRLRLTRFYSF